jgi:hypothetical protein
VTSGPWAHIDEGIRGTDCLGIMFDYEKGIASVSKSKKCVEEFVVVHWMEPDRGFIQNICDTHERGP